MGTRRVILRRYVDEPEDAWEEVSEEQAREVLAHSFDDVECVLKELETCPYVYTGNAFYKMEETDDI